MIIYEIMKQLILVLGAVGIILSLISFIKVRKKMKTKREKKREIKNFINYISLFITLIIVAYIYFVTMQESQRIIDKYNYVFDDYEQLISEKNILLGVLSTDCAEIVKNYTECMNDNKLINDMPFIQAAKNYVKNLTYDRQYFNCLDFNKGCVSLFKSMGYDAYIMAVSTTVNERAPLNNHAITIIELPVDCTDGFNIIPPENFKYYGVK